MLTTNRIEAQLPAGRVNALPTLPELASEARWDGFIFERHVIEAGALALHSLAQHCLLLPMGPSAVGYRCTLDGRLVQGDMVPGQVQFRAAGTLVATQWFARLDGIFVAIAPELIHRGLPLEDHGAPVPLDSELDPQDNPVLSQLILALDRQLRQHPSADPAYENLLRKSICANVAANYAAVPAQPGSRKVVGMSRKALRRVQEFVHAHLTSDFSIRDIADAVCLSPFHLSHAYHDTTGHSLWQYVIHCRSALAFALLTGHPDDSLRHIAELSGFESYAQFIAGFRKCYGVRPSDVRRALK